MDLQIEGKVKIRFQKPMPLKMHLRLAHMNTLMLMMNTYLDFRLQYIDYKKIEDYQTSFMKTIVANDLPNSTIYYIEYFMDLYWLLSIIHFKISKFDNWIKACL